MSDRISPVNAERLLDEALHLAIRTQRAYEQGRGFCGQSCQLANWEQLARERGLQLPQLPEKGP
jgi:hypothetical protein